MSVDPPKKGRYVASVMLWLVGFFIVMAFAGRGKISTGMALFSVSYVLLLPGVLIATLAYNLIVYPAKYRRWKSKFMCQDCRTIVETSPRAIRSDVFS